MMKESIGVIILAAGLSSRMGSPKPLLNLCGKTFLQHILSNPFLARKDVHTVLVVGHRQEKIQAQVPPSIQTAINPNYQEGRTTSVQCGLNELPSEIVGAFIWPVDCPLIPPTVLENLMGTLDSTSHICIPSYQYKRGHPPLIGSDFFPEILAMSPDEPLRNLYKRYPEALIHVTVDCEAVLHNVNTPKEYGKICEYYSKWLEESNSFSP